MVIMKLASSDGGGDDCDDDSDNVVDGHYYDDSGDSSHNCLMFRFLALSVQTRLTPAQPSPCLSIPPALCLIYLDQ